MSNGYATTIYQSLWNLYNFTNQCYINEFNLKKLKFIFALVILDGIFISY